MKHAMWLVVGILVWLPSVARAADLPCGPADAGTIHLDGLTDDWKEVDGIDAGGRDPNLSFTVKCNVEPRALYLLVDVRDNYFVRTVKAHPGEDHLVLSLAGHRITIFPGDSARIPNKIIWGKKKPPKGVQIVSALQPNGWAVELALPLGEVPGFHPGTPDLAFSLAAYDCDSKARLATERTIDTVGRLRFAAGASALDGFLKDRHLQPSDIFWSRPVRLGRGSGARVLLAKNYLAAITDEYVYISLPFSGRAEVKDVRLADLSGDGRQAVVIRYTERGSAGAREILAVFRVEGEQIDRVFAAEVGKSQGAAHLDDKVSFLRRGRATDILIEAGAAVGFTEATWREAPAEDVIPVLLPWGDDRRARYQFHGDVYQRK